uniref:Uncharacterized protein n=1 Tax=Oryza glumipatula TaxID=40148 RepID=A0A0D9Z8F1_9ORYZ
MKTTLSKWILYFLPATYGNNDVTLTGEANPSMWPSWVKHERLHARGIRAFFSNTSYTVDADEATCSIGIRRRTTRIQHSC